MVAIPVFPTQLLHTASYSYVARMQGDLARLQREVSSGRHDDLGLTLGTVSARDVSLRVHLADVEYTLSQAKQAEPKASLVQTSLDSLSKLATNFFDTISGARGAADGQKIAKDAARAALGTLKDILNTTYAGQYIFGGQNTDAAPFQDPLSGTPDAAIEAAFQGEFGISRDDPSMSQISGAEMETFLSGTFEGLFEETSWSGTWSTADSSNVLQRIGSATVDITANASGEFARKLTMAFSIMASLGEGNMSQAAFDTAIDKASAAALSAKNLVSGEQTRIGLAQQQISDEMDSLSIRKIALANSLDSLEAVDPYETATRVNSLMTQLQSSYAITARISQLSLLSFL